MIVDSLKSEVIMAGLTKLPQGYEIRTLNEEEFSPLWDEHAPKIFDENSQIFRLYRFLSDEEKGKAKALGETFGKPYSLNLGLFYEGKFAGWWCPSEGVA